MAKNSSTTVVGIRISSWAMFNGVLWGVIGLGIAVLHSLRNTVEFTKETESLLGGLAFGLVTGIVSIIVLPLVYFAIGWVIGVVQGWVFNIVARESGGIEFKLKD